MVTGYKGMFGSNKTASAVRDLWKLKCSGRRVLANIPLIDRRTRDVRKYWLFGEKFRTVPLQPDSYGRSWADGPVNPDTGATINRLIEIADLDNVELLLDEVAIWMSNRKWTDLEDAVLIALQQQRKDGLNMRWTTPREERIDKVLRELTHTLWHCERYGIEDGFGISYQRCSDPHLRKDLGWRILYLWDMYFKLYPTDYKVGSKDGAIAGRRGRNRMYVPAGPDLRDELPSEQVKSSGVFLRLPAFALLDRHEDEFGNVTYSRNGDNMQWWVDKELGRDVGPSPLASGGKGARGPARPRPGVETRPMQDPESRIRALEAELEQLREQLGTAQKGNALPGDLPGVPALNGIPMFRPLQLHKPSGPTGQHKGN